MIELQVHDWKYRVLKNGTLQSSPIAKDEWGEHSRLEMNRTGGDLEWITNTLIQAFHIMPEGYELPKSEKDSVKMHDGNKPL